jgi:hypothetical protein
MPGDFPCLGAFRRPGDEIRPQTFADGGNARTVGPDGEPRGPDDGFPGSPFIMGTTDALWRITRPSSPWEEIVAVTDDRRHHRVGDAAYDRAYNLLYDRFQSAR